MKVSRRLNTFGEMKKRCNVRRVNLSVKRDLHVGVMVQTVTYRMKT